VLGAVDDLPQLIEEHQIDEVIIALPEATHGEILDLVAKCGRANLNVKVFPDVFQIIASQVSIDDLGGLPLLSMRDGQVVGLEKVRTSRKALPRLAELAYEWASGMDSPRFAVHHLQSADAAATVVAELQRRLPGVACLTSEIGAVIGVHTGPGVVAVAVAPGTAT